MRKRLDKNAGHRAEHKAGYKTEHNTEYKAQPNAGHSAGRAERIIGFYQRAISPLHRSCCIYTPTCSEYARIAIQRWGLKHGSWLALKRLLRCHPLHKGGFDPVPDH